jgi:hypothetical protein
MSQDRKERKRTRLTLCQGYQDRQVRIIMEDDKARKTHCLLRKSVGKSQDKDGK